MGDPRALEPGDGILRAGVQWTHGLAAGLLDAPIPWATVSPFHHAALVGEGALIPSLSTVQTGPLDAYAADGWVFHVRAPSRECARAVQWATAHLGSPHGVEVILVDALMDAAHVHPPAR